MALSRVDNKFITSLESSKLFGDFPTSPQVDGSGLTGIEGVDLNSRYNLALNYFGDSVRNNKDRLSLDQGWVDTFEDASDVDGEGYSLQSTIFGGELYKKTAALTGSVNGKKGIISFWMDFNESSAGKNIFTSGGAENFVGLDGGHKLAIGFKNADAAGGMAFNGTKVFTNASGWYHVLVSYDLGGSGTVLSNVDMWITPLGGTEVSDHNKGTGTYVNMNVKYTEPTFALGGVAGTPSSLFRGSLAQCYWNYTDYLDISVEANRRKFTTADGYPINFGSTGSVPTGSQPIAYFDGDLSINKGTGGNLDVIEAIYSGGSPTLSGYLDLPDTNALYSSESFSNSYELIDYYGKENRTSIANFGGTGGFYVSVGQAFTLSSNTAIRSMGALVGRNSASITGTVHAEIYNLQSGSVNNSPIVGTILYGRSDSLDISTKDTSGTQFHLFTFVDPVILPAGDYCFVVNGGNTVGSAGNAVRVGIKNTAPAAGAVLKKASNGVGDPGPNNAMVIYLYGNKNIDLITKGSDDIGNSPATAPETGHMEVLMTEQPASGLSTFSDTLTVSGGGWRNASVRQIISASSLSNSGDSVRVKFLASPTQAFKMDNVAIVERAEYSAHGVGTPTELLFGGASGSNISPSGSVTSDWLEFSLDSSKDYLIIMDVNTDGSQDEAMYVATGGDGYYATSPANTFNTSQMTLPLGWSGTTETYAVAEIEVGVPQVLNTDIIAKMSRNGGTDYSNVTLTRTKTQVMGTDYNMLVGEADFTDGDATGTNIIGKIYTANKDKITVTGVSVNWK